MPDLTGKRLGKLVVIEKTEARDSSGCIIWRCKCDCGKRISFGWHKLRRIKNPSCGCSDSWAQKMRGSNGAHYHTSGRQTSSTFNAWHNMVQNCTNPKAPGYAKCGGSGITISDRWLKFSNFLDDMDEKPEGHKLCIKTKKWVAKTKTNNMKGNK